MNIINIEINKINRNINKIFLDEIVFGSNNRLRLLFFQ